MNCIFSSHSSSSDLVENSVSSSETPAAATPTVTTATSSCSSGKTTSTAASAKTASSSESTTSEFQQPTPPAPFSNSSSSQNNENPANPNRGSSDMQHLQASHPCHDESGVTGSSRDHRGDDNRSTDSGVSTIRSVSGDERSGSRSSTVSDERSLRPSPYLQETSSASPPTSGGGNNSHAHPSSQSGRSSGPPSMLGGPGSNPSAVWRDPALLAMHQARSAAAAGKMAHMGLHPGAAAGMADHHRQPGAPGAAHPQAPSGMSAAAASAAQFSALQHYQASIFTCTVILTVNLQTQHNFFSGLASLAYKLVRF